MGLMRTRFELDDDEATRLLGEGLTVLQAARSLEVSPQAIYLAISKGRVLRPDTAGAQPPQENRAPADQEAV